MIAGHATPAGTRRYFAARQLPASASHSCLGLKLAAIGAGTYGGKYNEEIGEAQKKALSALLAAGCNVIDTAPNYFDGKAEENVGAALAYCLGEGIARRDEIFIASKAGLKPESECLDGGEFDFTPAYLASSIKKSLARLNLECLDCLFVHNLELLAQEAGKDFDGQFQAIVNCMEELAERGLIKAWGVSSWDGFRVPPSDCRHLDLEKLKSLAGPNFRYLQAPLGLWGSEIATGYWQHGKTLLESAAGFGVFANTPLLQGEILPVLREFSLQVAEAICFSRDMAGVTSVLLGMKSLAHVAAWEDIQKNLTACVPGEIAAEFLRVLEKGGQGSGFGRNSFP